MHIAYVIQSLAMLNEQYIFNDKYNNNMVLINLILGSTLWTMLSYVGPASCFFAATEWILTERPSVTSIYPHLHVCQKTSIWAVYT